MPGGDRTGPMGFGPMTGRGAGLCAGSPVPGYMNPVGGRGFWGSGRGGRGRGRGWRHQYYATGLPGWQRYATGWPAPFYNVSPPARDEEVDALKQQAEMMKQSLANVQKRIDELESESS